MDSLSCKENKTPCTLTISYNNPHSGNVMIIITEGDTVKTVLDYLENLPCIGLVIDNVGYGYRVDPSTYQSFQIDLSRPIYFDAEFIGHRNLHVSIVRADKYDYSVPMLASELVTKLQRLISEHGDTMVVIEDTDGADREYVLTNAKFVSKTEPCMYQDRIILE